MSLFTALLQGLQDKIEKQQSYKPAVLKVLHDVVGVQLPPSAILSLQSGVLTLRISAPVKMAILLKKEVILKILNEQGIIVSVIK